MLSRSECLLSSVVGHWSSLGITSTVWSSATVVFSQSWTQASSSRVHLIASKEHLEESYVFSAVIGVFAGLMSASVLMHRKWASLSRFAKVVAGWLRRLVGCQSGQGSREVPDPSVPGRVRFASSLRMSIWQFQVQTRMTCRLPREKSFADFPEVSLQLLDPSDWRLAAYGGFFRDENIKFLKQVPSWMLSDMQRVVVRRDAF